MPDIFFSTIDAKGKSRDFSLVRDYGTGPRGASEYTFPPFSLWSKLVFGPCCGLAIARLCIRLQQQNQDIQHELQKETFAMTSESMSNLDRVCLSC